MTPQPGPFIGWRVWRLTRDGAVGQLRLTDVMGPSDYDPPGTWRAASAELVELQIHPSKSHLLDAVADLRVPITPWKAS